MTFRVYPSPLERPLTVAAGATNEAVPIEELVGSGPGGPTMFIRFAVIDVDCAPPAGPAPVVLLIADGSEFQVTSVDGLDPTPVGAEGAAFATIFQPGASGRGVYRLEVFKQTTAPIAWQIRFRNVHTGTRRFTWVVADKAAETRRPWIDLPAKVELDTHVGQSVTEAIQVANLGTGPLMLAEAAAPPPGPGLTLAVPGPISPNACASLRVRYTAPDTPTTPVTSTVDYTVVSDDTTSVHTVVDEDDFGFTPPATSHNGRVRLSATAHPPMPALAPGDIVLVDFAAFLASGQGGGVIRVNPATGEQTPVFVHGAFRNCSDVAFDAHRNLVFTESDSSHGYARVVRVDRVTGAVTTVSSRGHLITPSGIAEESDGDLLVISIPWVDPAVIRVHPVSGRQARVLSSTLLRLSPSIAVESDGSILVTHTNLGNEGFGKLLRVHPASGVVTTLSTWEGRFVAAGVAVEADRNILVAIDEHRNTSGVTRVDPRSGAQTPLLSGSLQDLGVRGIAIEADGGILLSGHFKFPPNPGSVTGVIRVHPVTGARTSVTSGGLLHSPHGMAIVPRPG